MIKVIGLVKRRLDMGVADFRAYWLGKHAEVERAALGRGTIRRIVVNFREHDLVGELPFDGLIEIYFDDREAMRRQWESGDDAAMLADEEDFCAPDSRLFGVVEEVVI